MRIKNKGEKCAREGCEKEAYTKSFCKTHYQNFHYHEKTGKTRKNKMPIIIGCAFKPCEAKHYMNGCCRKHWDALKNQFTVEQYNDFVGFVSRVKKCAVDDCTHIADCKSYCSRHYAQSKRHGAPLPDLKMKKINKNVYESAEEAFLDRFEMGKKDECWLWQSTYASKFPGFSYKGTFHMAHRFSYAYFMDQNVKGLHIDWHCKNAFKCVNPHHLEIVQFEKRKQRTALKKKDYEEGYFKRSEAEVEVIKQLTGQECYDSGEDSFVEREWLYE